MDNLNFSIFYSHEVFAKLFHLEFMDSWIKAK